MNAPLPASLLTHYLATRAASAAIVDGLSAEDCALLMNAIAGYDARDAGHVRAAPTPMVSVAIASVPIIIETR